MPDPRERPGSWHRQQYDVPAFIGRQIRFEDKPGRITGFRGPYLLAKVEGYSRSVLLHPTWKVEYLPVDLLVPTKEET
jgi:hypothetical protein